MASRESGRPRWGRWVGAAVSGVDVREALRSTWMPFAAGLTLIVVLILLQRTIGLEPPLEGGDAAPQTRSFDAEVGHQMIVARLAWGTSIFLMVAATIGLGGAAASAMTDQNSGRPDLQRVMMTGVFVVTLLAAATALVWLYRSHHHFMPQFIQDYVSKIRLGKEGSELSPLSLTPIVNTLVVIDLFLIMGACTVLLTGQRTESDLKVVLARMLALRAVMAFGAVCLVVSVVEVYLLHSLPTGFESKEIPADAIKMVAVSIATASGITYSVFLLVQYWIVVAVLKSRIREIAPRVFADTRTPRDHHAQDHSPPTLAETEAQGMFTLLHVVMQFVKLLAPALTGLLAILIDALSKGTISPG